MAEPSEAVIQQLVDELSILNTDLIGQKGTLSAAASQASADAAQVAADRSAIEAIEQAVSDDAATVDQLKASVDASQVEVATNTQIASDAATTATDQAAIATDAVAQIVNPVHMQSSLSQLDEHNYPKKTLYKNGDGFIAYYPEYAVFRKDSGAWEYVTPHLRNVLTLNGTTQYAVAPKVTELNLDDPNLAFEIEWTMSSDTPGTCILAQSLSQIASEREFMLFIRGSGDIGVITGGTETASGITPAEGEVCTMKYSNGNISFSSGAVSTEYAYQIGTARESVGNLLVGARRNGDNTSVSALYQGKLRDIKIWTGGDRSAGTLTRYYRMDEGWRGDSNNVLINYATELGEDVVVNGEFNGDLSGWTIETA
ncbi:hypothetical protein, partial [Vibrio casei]|uniref:hypothetical protein n=1 Tax=Vibrio casei TaxID=673372 RepID=UPI003F960EE3